MNLRMDKQDMNETTETYPFCNLKPNEHDKRSDMLTHEVESKLLLITYENVSGEVGNNVGIFSKIGHIFGSIHWR